MANTNYFDRISLLQSSVQGSTEGNKFNDAEKVANYPNQFHVDPGHPIIALTIRHGEVIDGITVTYKLNLLGPGKEDVTHGCSHKAHEKDPNLAEDTVTLQENEVISTVTGRTGQSSRFGVRVIQLQFVIYNTSTGLSRVAGPFGTNGGQPFSANGLTPLVALAGDAVDTDTSIGQLPPGQQGGLYGLSFITTVFRN